ARRFAAGDERVAVRQGNRVRCRRLRDRCRRRARAPRAACNVEPRSRDDGRGNRAPPPNGPPSPQHRRGAPPAAARPAPPPRAPPTAAPIRARAPRSGPAVRRETELPESPPPTTSAPIAEDSLAREATLLEQARAALANSPSQALATLEQHASMFPRGKLAPE